MKIRYCKNKKCNKGKNNKRKILYSKNKYCSDKCFRIYHKFKTYCQNPKCNNKLIKRYQDKYCSLSCSGLCRILSQEIRKKISKSKKGHSNKGKSFEILYGKEKADEIKTKLSNSKKGKKLSKEHIKNLIKSHTGLKQTKETIEKRVLKNTGKKRTEKQKLRLKNNSGMKGKHHTEKTKEQISKSKLNKGYGEDFKEKQRTIAFNRLIKNGTMINIGRNEKQLLDEQEIKDNCKILRCFPIKDAKCFVDGYCKETNTVYEIYEKKHLKQKEKDLIRQQKIQSFLNCKFKIIWDL
jgi:hypothetical protein